MKKILDISNNNPKAVYPNTKNIEILKHIEGDIESIYIQMGADYGTHIKSPTNSHMDKFPMELCINKCQVIDVPYGHVSEDFLRTVYIQSSVVFFNFLQNPSMDIEFDTDYKAIELSAAKLLTQYNLTMIGVNYLSVEKFEDGGDVYKELLGNNIWLLEGLDLNGIEEGMYEYYCMPLKLNTESSPTRVMVYKL